MPPLLHDSCSMTLLRGFHLGGVVWTQASLLAAVLAGEPVCLFQWDFCPSLWISFGNYSRHTAKHCRNLVESGFGFVRLSFSAPIMSNGYWLAVEWQQVVGRAPPWIECLPTQRRRASHSQLSSRTTGGSNRQAVIGANLKIVRGRRMRRHRLGLLRGKLLGFNL